MFWYMHTWFQFKSACSEIILQTHHTLLPDDRHPVFHAIHTIRNAAEVIFSQSLLISIKCTIVCASQLEVIAGRNQNVKAFALDIWIW